jgi:hypothetical protein
LRSKRWRFNAGEKDAEKIAYLLRAFLERARHLPVAGAEVEKVEKDSGAENGRSRSTASSGVIEATGAKTVKWHCKDGERRCRYIDGM